MMSSCLGRVESRRAPFWSKKNAFSDIRISVLSTIFWATVFNMPQRTEALSCRHNLSSRIKSCVFLGFLDKVSQKLMRIKLHL